LSSTILSSNHLLRLYINVQRSAKFFGLVGFRKQ
jgi:hypothetical protein